MFYTSIAQDKKKKQTEAVTAAASSTEVVGLLGDASATSGSRQPADAAPSKLEPLSDLDIIKRLEDKQLDIVGHHALASA